MKRLLSMTLACVLALSLCAPAAAEEVPAREDISAGSPEVRETLRQMNDEGLLRENTDYDRSYYFEDEEDEPTLTLVANGKTVDAALTAENGATYADAAALRAILGEAAVPADLTGPLPVRTCAEKAGWDVVWYDGGWRGVDRQVCLWDGKTLKARWEDEFGPALDFLKDLLAYSEATLAQTGGCQVEETITLDVTRFHSLDGDKTVTADIRVKEVFQDGVLDMTLEFNALDFLGLLDPQDLTALAQKGSFDLGKLKTLLRAGKLELLMDMKTYEIAVRTPLVTLFVPSASPDDWYGFQLPGAPALSEEEMEALPAVSSEELLDSLNIPELLYESLLSDTEYRGADADTRELAEFCTAFFGKDRFTHTGDAWTYSLTTGQVNQAVSDLLRTAAEESGVDFSGAALFKAYNISCAINTKTGAVEMKMDLRPDVSGIARLAWAEEDPAESSAMWMLLKALFTALDIQVTAQAKGDGKTATETMDVHWVNVGELSMKAEMKMGAATAAPRKPSQVTYIAPADRPTYLPMPDKDMDVGVIGGADGPTAITVAP